MAGRKTIYENEHLDARLEIKLTKSQKQALITRHKGGGPDPSKQMRDAWERLRKHNETHVLGIIPAGLPDNAIYESLETIVCTEHPGGKGYGYLIVRGDSMDRQVPDGAKALIKLNAPYRSGSTVAVALEWPDRIEFTLKVFTETEDGTVELHPDSTNKSHLPIVLSSSPPRGKRKVHWLKPETATVQGVFTGDYIYSGRK